MLLILPATVALIVLARPIVQLLFERNSFTAADTRLTTLALLVYAPSMIAAAIDQPLIFAFYARKNTLLPNLVQGAAIAAYLVVALGTVRWLGMYGLILGNVVQWTVHALVMLFLAHRRLDAVRGQRLGEAALKGVIASLGMGGAMWLALLFLGNGASQGHALLHLAVGSAVALLSYAGLVLALRLEAGAVFIGSVRARLRRG